MGHSERGYTVSEILVAVAIVGVLVAALTPLAFKQIDKSRDARASQDLERIEAAFVQYYADTQYWPCQWDPVEDDNDLGVFTDFTCLFDPYGVTGWDGPYLEESAGPDPAGRTVAAIKVGDSEKWQGMVDPWSRPFRYYLANISTDGREYGTIVLFCEGKNRTQDTPDAALLEGRASGDDIIRIVSRKAAD